MTGINAAPFLQYPTLQSQNNGLDMHHHFMGHTSPQVPCDVSPLNNNHQQQLHQQQQQGHSLVHVPNQAQPGQHRLFASEQSLTRIESERSNSSRLSFLPLLESVGVRKDSEPTQQLLSVSSGFSDNAPSRQNVAREVARHILNQHLGREAGQSAQHVQQTESQDTTSNKCSNDKSNGHKSNIKQGMSTIQKSSVKSNPKRKNGLSFDLRMHVIKLSESGKSGRKIAQEMGVSKTQVQKIVKNKDKIRMLYELMSPAERANRKRLKRNPDLSLCTSGAPGSNPDVLSINVTQKSTFDNCAMQTTISIPESSATGTVSSIAGPSTSRNQTGENQNKQTQDKIPPQLTKRTPRRSLNVEMKMHVIKLHEKGRTARKIARDLGVGKTQVQNLIKRKEEIYKMYKSMEPGKRMRKVRKTGNEEVNNLTFKWFQVVRSQNVPVSGSLLQQMALDFAKQLGNNDFKGSNGWLHAFRSRYNIKSIRGKTLVEGGQGISSERRKDVEAVTAEMWKAQLPQIISGFEPKNIFTMSEMGLFYKALPGDTTRLCHQTCLAGEFAGERLTVLMCCSMAGGKEKLLVIGKHDKQRHFRNIITDTLPVIWRNNKRACMNPEVFREWVTAFDMRMGMQDRKVVLFVENIGCHPDVDLKHVHLMFLPLEGVSKLQPLKQGVMKAVKTGYRKSILQCTLGKQAMRSSNKAFQSVNVLDSIFWLDKAWKALPGYFISHCFHQVGFPKESELQSQDLLNYTAVDNTEGEVLLKQLDPNAKWEEYLIIDNSLATHCQTAGNNLDRHAANVMTDGNRPRAGPGSDGESDGEMTEGQQKIKSLAEFVHQVERLKNYALSQGHGTLLEPIMELRDRIPAVQTKHGSLLQEQLSHVEYVIPLQQ